MKDRVLAAQGGNHGFVLSASFAVRKRGRVTASHQAPRATIPASPTVHGARMTTVVFRSSPCSRPGILLSRLFQVVSDQDVCASCEAAPQDPYNSEPAAIVIPSPQTTEQAYSKHGAQGNTATDILHGLMLGAFPAEVITMKDGVMHVDLRGK